MSPYRLPKGYVPFKELVVCSNTFSGNVPFLLNGDIPLLVGKGDVPKVWLRIPANDPMTKWREVITANRSVMDPIVKVFYSKQDKTTTVMFNSSEILKVQKVSEFSAVIHRLDLTPFGLSILGDSGHLKIGSNLFASNTIASDVMVNIGRGAQQEKVGKAST